MNVQPSGWDRQGRYIGRAGGMGTMIGSAPRGIPTGPMRAFTGANTGLRSNLSNLFRLHLQGVRVDVVRRSREVAKLVYEKARDITIRHDLIATRTYFEGWEVYNTKTGAVVRNRVPHATVIETGRVPGTFAPPGRIHAWMIVKAGRFWTAPEASAINADGDQRYWALRRGAYLINLKIQQQGIEPIPVMKRAAHHGRQQFIRKLIHTLVHYRARYATRGGAAPILFTTNRGQARGAGQLTHPARGMFRHHYLNAMAAANSGIPNLQEGFGRSFSRPEDIPGLGF